MRVILGMVFCLCLLLSIAWAGQPATQEDKIDLVLKELSEMKVMLADVQKRVQAIEENLETSAMFEEDVDSFHSSPPGFPVRAGADLKALSKIKIPEVQDKAGWKEYVNRIQIQSMGQTSFSTMDPQVRMLRNVGSENVDVLIQALQDNRMSNIYLLEAIKNLAGQEHKDLILESLSWAHGLVPIVQRQGWEQDAHDILCQELKIGTEYLPTEWLQATASLQDETSLELLTSYMASGNCSGHDFDAVVPLLPEYDWQAVVDEAWRELKFGDTWKRNSMASCAIQYGHVDALGVVIQSLDEEERSIWNGRQTVLRHITISGSNQEIQNWYNENKDSLVWLYFRTFLRV